MLVLAEPMVMPGNDLVMKLGLKDFSDEIIHNGDSNVKPNFW